MIELISLIIENSIAIFHLASACNESINFEKIDEL